MQPQISVSPARVGSDVRSTNPRTPSPACTGGHKSELALIEHDRVGDHVATEHLAPPCSHRRRIIRLDLDRQHVRDHVVADVLPPDRSGPGPFTPRVSLVERQDRPADVCRMEVETNDPLPRRLEHDPSADLLQTATDRVEVVDFEDHHVAAVSTTFVE